MAIPTNIHKAVQSGKILNLQQKQSDEGQTIIMQTEPNDDDDKSTNQIKTDLDQKRTLIKGTRYTSSMTQQHQQNATVLANDDSIVLRK